MARFDSKSLNQLIEKHPIVPVFYHDDIELTREILLACYAGGMRAFEFTNRGEKAGEVFTALYPFVEKNCPEMALGIGTIFHAEQARAFVEAGADFVVQPVITPAVGQYCQDKDIAWYPGASTLNEIFQATQLGAEIVKIFPGNVVGPGFIKSLKGPMPHVKVMVTGGVDPTTDSLLTWFGAGVTAVGIGSQLFPKALLEKRQFEELTKTIVPLMNFVNNL
ncbi:2-keto-3-deoxy-phosphogluconate aldolase [Pseudarcicella hirudinis]|uniref:2-keto-3-deoxy-phosphogluconate aldolase n=1 Tax=Pseudarcicella hirudinis TaxID=1079859 RepID=A0A1I5XXS6_9BACT|nr:bifunctional 4-hydroxy-2-oxoglutarate aldolase/2-dehydro-3-deoxy-phosphogluconate aldolase [Pseudarcicella hirudinis]SFQ36735.1 2-keto-3-deoxy-phosphogluconate aldolase [Pseudarcicella hirudinis]